MIVCLMKVILETLSSPPSSNSLKGLRRLSLSLITHSQRKRERETRLKSFVMFPSFPSASYLLELSVCAIVLAATLGAKCSLRYMLSKLSSQDLFEISCCLQLCSTTTSARILSREELVLHSSCVCSRGRSAEQLLECVCWEGRSASHPRDLHKFLPFTLARTLLCCCIAVDVVSAGS